jgi:hypothetical protein
MERVFESTAENCCDVPAHMSLCLSEPPISSCVQPVPLNLPYVDSSVNPVYLGCYIAVVDSVYQNGVGLLEKSGLPVGVLRDLSMGEQGLSGEVMDTDEKLDGLSYDVKVLKSEIRQILLDIREHVRTYYENPMADEDGSDERHAVSDLGIIDGEESEEQFRVADGTGLIDRGPSVRMEAGVQQLITEEDEPPSLSSASFKEQSESQGMRFVMDGGGHSLGDDFLAEDQEEVDVYQENDVVGVMELLGARRDNGDRGAKRETYRQDFGEELEDGDLDGPLELTTVAMLTRWVSNGVGVVGRRRMETIVEMYQMMGNMSPRTKEAIVRLIRLSDCDEPKGAVPTTACVPILMQLNVILGDRQQQMIDPTLLSMLL